MSKLNLTYKLKPLASVGLGLDDALDSLREQMVLERSRQTEALEINKNTDCTSKTNFSSSAARNLQLPVNLWPIKRQFPWDEMTRSETRRILSTWQHRCQVARVLDEHDYDLDYSARPEDLRFVKQQLWENVKRSKKTPALPRIKSVRLPLSKSSTQYSWIYQEGPRIELYLTTIEGDCLLVFELPDKVYQQYSKAKVCRPDLVLSENDELSFVFSLEFDAPKTVSSISQIVGLDLGLARAYAASVVSGTEVYSFQSESLEVYRDRCSLAKIDEKIKAISSKNKRRGLLGVTNFNATLEEKRLRAKRSRIIESLDWQIASDVVSLVDPGGLIALEKLSWSGGGAVKFRHGLQQAKIEHVASKRGRRVKRVSASYSSQECPDCSGRVKADSQRVIACDCGYMGDRDTAASLVIAKRAGAKLTGKKCQPTPKRPKPRKTLIKMVRKTGFTGSSLINSTVEASSLEARLMAGYCSPIGTVGATWRKRLTYW